MFKLAIISLKKKRGRSLLTILGVVIGITAVIVVMSAGQGIKGYILGEIEAFGSDWIEVEIKVPNVSKTSTANAMGIAMGVEITTLKTEDMEALLEHPNISHAYAGVMGQDNISYLNENKTTMLFGVTEDMLKIDKGEVEHGRFFTKEENDSIARVAVLGLDVREKFFGPANPIGQKIKIGKNKFEVIGVMKERGSAFGFNWDDMVIMPLQTLQKKVMGIDHIMFMLGKLDNPDIVDQTASDLTAIMREQHGITDPDKDDFAVTSMQEALSIVGVVINAIQILLIVIACISLIVGGVGIMNVMYVNVNERTPEIGLRKAVGAKKGDILWQFLAEAVIITLLGGIIGITFGVLLAFTISKLATMQGFNWQFILPPQSIILAFGFCTIVGLIFGIYPARKASKLDPITALRK